MQAVLIGTRLFSKGNVSDAGNSSITVSVLKIDEVVFTFDANGPIVGIQSRGIKVARDMQAITNINSRHTGANGKAASKGCKLCNKSRLRL